MPSGPTEPPEEKPVSDAVLRLELAKGGVEELGDGWSVEARTFKGWLCFRLVGPDVMVLAFLWRDGTTTRASDCGHLGRTAAGAAFAAGVPDPGSKGLSSLLPSTNWWDTLDAQAFADTGQLTLVCESTSEPSSLESGLLARCLCLQILVLRAIRAALPTRR